MAYDDKIVAEIVSRVMAGLGTESTSGNNDTVPVGVSNRHIHLSTADLETLSAKVMNLPP